MKVKSKLQTFTISGKQLQLFVPEENILPQSIHSPYWGKVWPAALGLCQFLQNNLHYLQRKTVTELAAGLGLTAIFAAEYAATVYCSDIEPAAVALIEKSAAYNKLGNVQCKVKSWSDYYGDINPETLLLSDVNYEPEQFEKLLEMVQYYLEHRCTVIISTPQRLMAKSFIEKLMPFCVQQDEVFVNEEGKETAVSVFVLKADENQ